ncbi:YkgJ family cysteine cluster protein [Vulcanisaeta souniana]|uniref:YkgJ family cysteine cluster protein n=1 Tax=Vulcanisaeta souniana TaxID=164452 RepID=UPI0006D11BC1|nr:YkgJ family cysteine cluster protein [Vulcanisaeta souniana]
MMKAEFPRVRFTCVLCGECCRRYWIPVTHRDVARIARYTGMRPREFLALFPKEMAADWDEPVIRLRDGEYYLVLKKRLDGTCIFNKWIGDKLICSVHSVKPNVCRYYPFIYWLNGDIAKFEVYDKALGYCPPGIGKGGYVDLKIEISSISDAVKAKTEFREIINKWDELVREGSVNGTLEEFMDYLEKAIDAYSRKNS